MADPRVENLVRLVSDYCLDVRKGDEVLVSAGVEALPLVREIYKRVLQRGGLPFVYLSDDALREIYFRYASEEQLKTVARVEEFIARNFECQVSIISSSHAKPLIGVDPERLKISSGARKKLTEIFMERHAKKELRWNVTIYPTMALAQEAGMGPIEFEEFVYRACMVDEGDSVERWRRKAGEQERIAQTLNKVDELRFKSPDMDLVVKVGGRRWINDDGHYNMPAGEVFTGPVEDSAEGYVRFSYPAVWRGIEVEDVRLTFRRGEVVEARAGKGEEHLRKLLETDEGARRLGELAFGLNYNITRHTKLILFDEKIGGTIHMALGASYPDTGGRNKSAIHWDLIADMSRGKVYADGDLIYENGRFLV